MELKPCLKCQSSNVHYFKEEYHPLYNLDELVVCNSCGIEVKCTLEQWNTRATDPLLKEMASSLENMIEAVRGGWKPSELAGEFEEAKVVLQKYHEQEAHYDR